MLFDIESVKVFIPMDEHHFRSVWEYGTWVYDSDATLPKI